MRHYPKTHSYINQIMRFLSALILLLLSSSTFAQSNPPSESPVDEGKVFTFTEVQPEYPGGEAELIKFLQKHIHYPAREKKQGLEGQVVITFVINKYGKVEGARVVKEIPNAPAFGKEALRVINLMPDWKPATQAGKYVAVQYNLPLTFHLPKAKIK